MEILIVHITDMHIENENDLNILSSRTENIGGTICNHITTPQDTCVFVCVTGDFTNAGKEEQFIMANMVLEDIFSVLKRRYPDVDIYTIFVPGNHDCDFEHPNSGVRNVLLKSQCFDITDTNQMKQCTSIQKTFLILPKK